MTNPHDALAEALASVPNRYLAIGTPIEEEKLIAYLLHYQERLRDEWRALAMAYRQPVAILVPHVLFEAKLVIGSTFLTIPLALADVNEPVVVAR